MTTTSSGTLISDTIENINSITLNFMPPKTPQTPATKAIAAQMRGEIEAMPDWLRRPIGKASEISQVQKIIKQRQIHTICEEGRCPNRGE